MGTFITLKNCFEPKNSGNYYVIKNSWWIVTSDNEPVFWKTGTKNRPDYSPQCNTNKQLAEVIGKNLKQKLMHDVGPVKLKYVETVFLPHRCEV